MLTVPPALPFNPRMLSRLLHQIKAAVHKLTVAEQQVFVQAIGITPLKTGGRVLRHSHPYYEVHIVLQGNACYFSGEERIVEPGTIFLHGPKIPHAFYALDTNCQILAIEFSVSPGLSDMESALQTYTLNVLWEIQLLFDEAAQRAPGWQDRVARHLCAILSRGLVLASDPGDNRLQDSHEESDIIAVIDKYCRENLQSPVRLDDVADYAGMSRSTLTSMFRRLTGESVMGYLHQLRMAEAHVLVVNTRQPLSEIAKRIGIPDPAYFSNCFRKYHRYSPQQTRKLLAKGEYISEI